MSSAFFHVDLDAFFASVEQQDNPGLAGKPVIVGADPRGRGVVSACSYEAREFGVHSAMPISTAFRKCPQGVFLPVRMARYTEISSRIMTLLRDFTPRFQQMSVDEAFLDMTGTRRLYGPPLETGRKIKEMIKKETGLNISVGIAPNKYLAKLASDFDKPDGLWEILPGQEEAFIDQLPLPKLWGLGKKGVERLGELNITTTPQLRKFPLNILTGMLGQAMGWFLYRAVRGEDPGTHQEEPKSHSISNEVTFSRDRRDIYFLNKVFLELSHQVMFRLIEENYEARTLFIKLRYQDFSTITRQVTLKHNLYSAEELYKAARELFNKHWNGHTPVRLIGLGLTNLTPRGEHVQQDLFEEPDSKKEKVEKAVFDINRKQEGLKLIKASLLKEKNQP